MNNTAGTWLANPDSPYAWLTPSLGLQFEASCLLYVAVLGAWSWDFLTAIPEEYRLVFKTRFSGPQVAYIIARLSSFSYILTSTIFQVAYVDNCSALQKALGWSATVAIPSNSILFFIRIRAVFFYNRPAVVFFACLWAATLVSFCIPFAIDGVHIGDTHRCINSATKRFSSMAIIVSTVHDTIVFAAITWRLLWYNIAETTWSARLRSFVSGEGMGSMSKAVLQTGQSYYLVTVGMNILTVVMLLIPSGPVVIHAMFTVPNIALTNVMACRVFRKLKLGIIEDHPALTEDYSLSTMRAASSGRRRPTVPGESLELHTVSLPTSASTSSTKKGSVAVNITHEVESDTRSDFRKPMEVV